MAMYVYRHGGDAVLLDSAALRVYLQGARLHASAFASPSCSVSLPSGLMRWVYLAVVISSDNSRITLFVDSTSTTCRIVHQISAEGSNNFVVLPENGDVVSVDRLHIENSALSPAAVKAVAKVVWNPVDPRHLCAQWVFDVPGAVAYDVSGRGRHAVSSSDGVHVNPAGRALQGLSAGIANSSSWDAGGVQGLRLEGDGRQMSLSAWWRAPPPLEYRADAYLQRQWETDLISFDANSTTEGGALRWQVHITEEMYQKQRFLRFRVAVAGYLRSCVGGYRPGGDGWWHVAAVVTQYGTVLYVNSVVVAQCTTVHDPVVLTHPMVLSLGRTSAVHTFATGELMDDVRIYDTALPAGDVARIMQEAVPRHAPFLFAAGPYLATHFGHPYALPGVVAVGRVESPLGLHLQPVDANVYVSEEDGVAGSAAVFVRNADAKSAMQAPLGVGSAWQVLRGYANVVVSVHLRASRHAYVMPVASMQDSLRHDWAVLLAVGAHSDSVVTSNAGRNCIANTTRLDRWTRITASYSSTATDIYLDGAHHTHCGFSSAQTVVPEAEEAILFGSAHNTNCSEWSGDWCHANFFFQGALGRAEVGPLVPLWASASASDDSSIEKDSDTYLATDAREVFIATFNDAAGTTLVRDESSSRRPAAVIVGDATLAAGALQLSGGGLSLGASSTLESEFSDALSFSLWIRPSARRTVQTLLGSPGFLKISFTPQTDSLTAWHSFQTAQNETCIKSLPHTAYTWQHVAWTYRERTAVASGDEGQRVVTLYADGADMGECLFSGSSGAGGLRGWGQGGRALMLGAVDGEGNILTDAYYGWVENVRLVARTLSGAEVRREVSEGRTTTEQRALKVPLVWYDLEEAMDTTTATLRDSSVNRAHAKLVHVNASWDETPAKDILYEGSTYFTVPLPMSGFFARTAVMGAYVQRLGTTQMSVFGVQDAVSMVLDTNGHVHCTFGTATATSVVQVGVGVWHHVACSWEQERVAVYVDGARSAEETQDVPETLHLSERSQAVLGRSSGRCRSQWYCEGLFGRLDDVVLASPYSHIAAFVRDLAARRTLRDVDTTYTWHSGSTARSYKGVAQVESLVCSRDFTFATGRAAGVAVQVLQTVDHGMQTAHRTSVREQTGAHDVPHAYNTPQIHHMAQVAASGNTLAVSSVHEVTLYRRHSPARAWYHLQALPVVRTRREAVHARYYGEVVNGTVAGNARMVSTTSFGGAAVAGGARIAMDLGGVRRVVSLTVGTRGCRDHSCWLQSFTVATSNASTSSPLPWRFSDLHAAGVLRTFYMPMPDMGGEHTVSATFSFDPPLHAQHIALVNTKSVGGAVSRVAMDVAVQTAQAQQGALPPLVAVTPRMLYVTEQGAGVCHAQGVFSASSTLTSDPACAVENAALHSGDGAAWCAASTSTNEHLDLDLGEVKHIHSVTTRRRSFDTSNLEERVTQYTLHLRNHTTEPWIPHATLQGGDEVWHNINLKARHLQWRPTAYVGWVSMQVGVRVVCRTAGATSLFRRTGDGWLLDGVVAKGVVLFAARRDVAVGVVEDAVDGHVMQVWRGGASIHTEDIASDVVSIAVSDDASVVVLLTTTDLLIFRARQRTITKTSVLQLPHHTTCTSTTVTNPSARHSVVHTIYVLCGTSTHLLTARHGEAVLSDTLSHEHLTHISSGEGVVCAGGDGVLVWGKERDGGVQPVVSNVAFKERNHAEVASAVLTQPGSSEQMWVGDGMDLVCEQPCSIDLSDHGSSVPVYLLGSSGVTRTEVVRTGRDITSDGTFVTESAAYKGATRLYPSGDCAALVTEGATTLTILERGSNSAWGVQGEVPGVPIIGTHITRAAWNHTAPESTNTTELCVNDGVITDYGSLGAAAISGTLGVSVAAWVKVPQNVSESVHVMQCTGVSQSAATFSVRLVNMDSTHQMRVRYSVTNGIGSATLLDTAADGVSAGWAHIAVVHSAQDWRGAGVSNRAVIFVNGVQVVDAVVRLPSSVAYSCYVGWDGASTPATPLTLRDVYLWNSVAKVDDLALLREGRIAPSFAAANLFAADGCHAATRTAYAHSVAFNACSQLFVSAASRLNGSIAAFSKTTQGETTWTADFIITPPADMQNPTLFGSKLAVIEHAEDSYLVALQGGGGGDNAANMTLELYRVTTNPPAAHHLSRTHLHCFDGADLSGGPGGVVVLCPQRAQTTTLLFELVPNRREAPVLREIWAQGGALSVVTPVEGTWQMSVEEAAAAWTAPSRLEHEDVSWDAPQAYNGTAGPAVLTLRNPLHVTFVARYAFNDVDDFTGRGVHLLSGPNAECSLDGNYIACSIGLSGYEAQRGRCRVQYVATTATPLVFMLQYAWDVTTGTATLAMQANAHTARCGMWLGAWTSTLHLGHGFAGSVGPLRIMLGEASTARSQAVFRSLQSFPHMPSETNNGGFVYLYKDTTCAGSFLKVPFSHSEQGCDFCWDTCGKTWPDGNSVTGGVGSVRLSVPDETAAVVAFASATTHQWWGCMKLNTTVYSRSDTVQGCADACNTAFFALQNGKCVCSDNVHLDMVASVFSTARVADADCGVACTGETSSAGTLLCGTDTTAAVYTKQGVCFGQWDLLPNSAAVQHATSSDGCVPLDSTVCNNPIHIHKHTTTTALGAAPPLPYWCEGTPHHAACIRDGAPYRQHRCARRPPRRCRMGASTYGWDTAAERCTATQRQCVECTGGGAGWCVGGAVCRDSGSGDTQCGVVLHSRPPRAVHPRADDAGHAGQQRSEHMGPHRSCLGRAACGDQRGCGGRPQRGLCMQCGRVLHPCKCVRLRVWA